MQFGDRAFSDNIEEVSQCGVKYIEKLKEEGIIPVIKHFPGHGATKVDSHFLLPIITKRNRRIRKK